MPPKGRMLFLLITSNAHQFHCSFKHIFSQYHNESFFFVRNIWPDTSGITLEVQQNTTVIEEKKEWKHIARYQKPFSDSMPTEIRVKAATERVEIVLLFE